MIRRNGQEIELVELVWGLRPRNAEEGLIINVRSEGRTFPSHRCLIPATDFFLRDKSPARTRWRFTLADGDSFYFAGTWRPASDDWPEAYAVLTTASNPEVAPVNDRHMAVIPRAARLDWLDALVCEEEAPAASCREPAWRTPAKRCVASALAAIERVECRRRLSFSSTIALREPSSTAFARSLDQALAVSL